MAEITVFSGHLNTDDETIQRQVAASIRRQYPQIRPYQPQGTPMALVAGGPSLNVTAGELRDLVFEGVQVATVNGAYQWCIDRNIKPSLAIALDARPQNAEFFRTPVPKCKYLMASQCAPETFDMLEGRDVWLFHAVSTGQPELDMLDAYYGKNRHCPITLGSTVTLRALSILRILGFLRIDVFGFDSCWLGMQHHAYTQALNDRDGHHKITMKQGPHERVFYCAPWHLKQLKEFHEWIKERGSMCDLHVHGDGMIAHSLVTGAKIVEEHKQKAKVACG